MDALLDDVVTLSEVGQARMRLQTLVMLAFVFFGLVVPVGLDIFSASWVDVFIYVCPVSWVAPKASSIFSNSSEIWSQTLLKCSL